jgi:group I intron endonuclease
MSGVVGIYRWTHRLTGKAYVGQSIDVGNRFCGHLNEFLRGASLPLYRDMMDDGPEGFVFELLERCSPARLDEREEWHIAQHVNSGKPLYNLLSVTREPNPEYAKDRGNRYVLPEEERRPTADASAAVEDARQAIDAIRKWMRSVV